MDHHTQIAEALALVGQRQWLAFTSFGAERATSRERARQRRRGILMCRTRLTLSCLLRYSDGPLLLVSASRR